jgi:hypothetical protein
MSDPTAEVNGLCKVPEGRPPGQRRGETAR